MGSASKSDSSRSQVIFRVLIEVKEDDCIVTLFLFLVRPLLCMGIVLSYALAHYLALSHNGYGKTKI